MSKKLIENQGEGNPLAAARFNEAQSAFVKSPRGKQAIAGNATVKPEDEAALEEADNEGMTRKKPR